MDDRLEEEDSEMDLLLWMSTPTSSLRSSKRRLRYLKKINIYIFFLDLDFLYTFNDFPYILLGYYVHF